MKGCTFPGRMISWAGVVCLGATTDTVVTASCEVSAPKFVLAFTRDQIPYASRAATANDATARASHRVRADFFVFASFCGPDCPAIPLTSSVWLNIVAPIHVTPNSDYCYWRHAGVNAAAG